LNFTSKVDFLLQIVKRNCYECRQLRSTKFCWLRSWPTVINVFCFTRCLGKAHLSKLTRDINYIACKIIPKCSSQMQNLVADPAPERTHDVAPDPGTTSILCLFSAKKKNITCSAAPVPTLQHWVSPGWEVGDPGGEVGWAGQLLARLRLLLLYTVPALV
jgi:hypothetical protein